VQIRREGLEHPAQRAALDPNLEATMTGLVGRVPIGEILPRRPRAENPENAVQHVPRIAPGPAPPVVTHAWRRQERREDRPLGVGEVHTAEYDGPSYFVHIPVSRFMR
jgi:hypothetical protein